MIGSLEVGGTQKHVFDLLRHLDPTEFEVSVVVLASGGYFWGEVRRLGIPIHSLDVSSKWTLFTRFFTFLNLVRRLRPAVMHVFLFHSSLYGCLARLLFLGSGPKLILSKRSMDLGLDLDRYLAYRFVLMRTPDVITAVSGPVAARCRSLSAPARKVRVIPNGIDSPARASIGALRHHLGLDQSLRLVGSVGSLSPRKQHHLLIASFTYVLAEHPQARLVLIGEGPLRHRLETQVRHLGLDRYVLFAGALTPAADYIGDLSVFVLPSSEEGTSNALLEAMSAGVPCVVSDIPANRALIVTDLTGVVVDVNNSALLATAISRLLSDRHYAESLSSGALEHLRQHHGIDRMVAANEQLYRQLTAVAGT